MISKIYVPPSSIISHEPISQLFTLLEYRIKANLGPLINLVNLMPTATPYVSTGVQVGEKGVGASKNVEQVEVVGKV